MEGRAGRQTQRTEYINIIRPCSTTFGAVSTHLCNDCLHLLHALLAPQRRGDASNVGCRRLHSGRQLQHVIRHVCRVRGVGGGVGAQGASRSVQAAQQDGCRKKQQATGIAVHTPVFAHHNPGQRHSKAPLRQPAAAAHLPTGIARSPQPNPAAPLPGAPPPPAPRRHPAATGGRRRPAPLATLAARLGPRGRCPQTQRAAQGLQGTRCEGMRRGRRAAEQEGRGRGLTRVHITASSDAWQQRWADRQCSSPSCWDTLAWTGFCSWVPPAAAAAAPAPASGCSTSAISVSPA